MVDTFSVKMRRRLGEPSAVWREAQIFATAIESVHESAGGDWPELPWSMAAAGRSWDRATMPELRRIAKEHSLAEFTVYWEYAVDGLQWSITGSVYESYSSDLEVLAYAGEDRMTTERAVRLVAATAARRGIDVTIGETSISSSDSPGRSTAAKAKKPTPLRDTTPGILARAGAAIARHFGAFVVGVLSTVVAAMIIVLLRLNG